jgi:predicted  nucleic acid-binding Zn-ribbon protein
MNTSIDQLIQKLQQKIATLKKSVKHSDGQINEINDKLQAEKQKIINRINSELQAEKPTPKLLANSSKKLHLGTEQIENLLEQII